MAKYLLFICPNIFVEKFYQILAHLDCFEICLSLHTSLPLLPIAHIYPLALARRRCLPDRFWPWPPPHRQQASRWYLHFIHLDDVIHALASPAMPSICAGFCVLRMTNTNPHLPRPPPHPSDYTTVDLIFHAHSVRSEVCSYLHTHLKYSGDILISRFLCLICLCSKPLQWFVIFCFIFWTPHSN